MERDRTSTTEPLTIGQQIVAKWESLNSGWSEPADLAEAIDAALAAENEACAKLAEQMASRLGGHTGCTCYQTVPEAIRSRRTG